MASFDEKAFMKEWSLITRQARYERKKKENPMVPSKQTPMPSDSPLDGDSHIPYVKEEEFNSEVPEVRSLSHRNKELDQTEEQDKVQQEDMMSDANVSKIDVNDD